MSAAQLQQLAYERKLMPVDLVRRGFGETWTDAARVKGLKFGPGSVLCAPESPSIFKPSDVHKAISPPPKDLVDPPIVSPHQNAPTATAIKVFVNATVSSFGLIWHEGSRVCRIWWPSGRAPEWLNKDLIPHDIRLANDYTNLGPGHPT